MSKIRCKRCKRELTDPESIGRGYGPICWRKLHEKTIPDLEQNKTNDSVVEDKKVPVPVLQAVKNAMIEGYKQKGLDKFLYT